MQNQMIVLGLAMMLDLCWGEPPVVVHPVAWMGSVISFFYKRAPRKGRFGPFLAGILLMLIGIMTLALGGTVFDWGARVLPLPARLIVEAILFKTTFSLRGLFRAGHEVQSVLAKGNLPEARKQLSWHLVSRDTTTLNESQVAGATIESLAENTNDSIVAPLMYFIIGGWSGALIYRFINTCDAMLGYRDPEREWLGKFPARFDDLVNLIPARITAFLLIAAGALTLHNPARSIFVWCRDRNLTSSPNAGHPMSAIAGVLRVELEKVGHYQIGNGFRQPNEADVSRANQLLLISSLLAFMSAFGLIAVMNGGS